MNALKEFVTKNKLLVSITGSVTLCAFMVFSIIAFAIGDTGSAPADTEKKSTTTGSIVAENDSQTEQSTTQPQYTGETATYGEEGTEDQTEEPTTVPPVDPDTLPYIIKVNRIANCLTVYAKDDNGEFTIPHKAITVSCGKDLEDTPTGTYQTIVNYEWRKMVDGTYAQNAYRIVGSILFHSVPYYTLAKNDLEWEEFNKLGTSASLGCVRMTVADAKWLMDNCPIGTKVIIYDDINNPGPLGKPETIKIPADIVSVAAKFGISADKAPELQKWDPTDPDPANPWRNCYATITHPSSKQVTVEAGATIEDIRSHFKAHDTCGNEITHKIEFTGNYDLNTPGIYSDIVVSVTDAIGSHVEVKIVIIVNEKETESETETSTEGESSSSESDSSSENESSSSNEDESTSVDDESNSSTENESSSSNEDESTSSESNSSSENQSSSSESQTTTIPSSEDVTSSTTPSVPSQSTPSEEPSPEEKTTPATPVAP